MGSPMKPLDPQTPQALLICGLLSADSRLMKEIETTLVEHFGPVGLRSELVPFTW
ncbi:unnamed protein product, partial [marine sediment metagenome]